MNNKKGEAPFWLSCLSSLSTTLFALFLFWITKPNPFSIIFGVVAVLMSSVFVGIYKEGLKYGFKATPNSIKK